MAAMPATLNLAAAGNLELATAADIASNVMSGFGAEAKDLGQFIDVLAAGFTNSNTDLNQLGEAMANAAPVASGFGVSIEETTAAIGLLSNAGIQGGQAGTSLKNILVQLDEQSESLGLSIFDAAGNMIPLSDQLAQLESKGLSTSDIMGKFGKIAGPGLLALMKEGSSGLSDLTGTLENSGGTAKKVADQQMKGLAGTMTRLKSATEGLAISFGELILPVIEKLANFVIGLVTAWTNLDGGIKIAIITLATLAATLAPLIAIFGAIASPIGLAVIAIATLAAAFVFVIDNWEALKERFTSVAWWKNMLIDMQIKFNEFAGFLFDGYNKVLDFLGMETVANPFETAIIGLKDLKDETVQFKNEFGTFGDAVSNAADKAKSALGGIGAVIGFGGGGGGGSESSGESGGESSGGGGEESGGEEGGGTLTGALTVVKGKFDGLIASSKEFGVAMVQDFAAGMGQAIASGQKFGQAFKQIFADMLKQIIALIVQAAILAALFAMIPGLGAASGFAKGGMGFKDILSGSLQGRASGGSVAGGTPYMVGENGPELFMSNTGGNIVPNHALGGGGRLHGQFTLSGADMILAIDNQLAADTNGSNPGLLMGTASVSLL